jgi:hypothetical protein
MALSKVDCEEEEKIDLLYYEDTTPCNFLPSENKIFEEDLEKQQVIERELKDELNEVPQDKNIDVYQSKSNSMTDQNQQFLVSISESSFSLDFDNFENEHENGSISSQPINEFLESEGKISDEDNNNIGTQTASTLLQSLDCFSEQTILSRSFDDFSPRLVSPSIALVEAVDSPCDRNQQLSDNRTSIDSNFIANNFHRRKNLPFSIVQLENGNWKGTITMKQPLLRKGDNSPQGTRSDKIVVGVCRTRELCEDLCMTVAPPVWSNKQDTLFCKLCNCNFGMFRQGHHCRNCGNLVCTSCSEKRWPGLNKN